LLDFSVLDFAIEEFAVISVLFHNQSNGKTSKMQEIAVNPDIPGISYKKLQLCCFAICWQVE
jgi:hypothetical protein